MRIDTNKIYNNLQEQKNMSFLSSILQPITAPISAVGGFVQSMVNTNAQKRAAELNYKSQRETNQLQKELAQYSYEQQKSLIDAQNEYNLPRNQVQRYIDAGINPNAVIGQISAGNQNQIANYQSPRLTAPIKAAVQTDMFTSGLNNLLQSLTILENLKQQKLQNEKQETINQYLDENEFFKRMLNELLYKDKWVDSNVLYDLAGQDVNETAIYNYDGLLKSPYYRLRKLGLDSATTQYQDTPNFYDYLRKQRNLNLNLDNLKQKLLQKDVNWYNFNQIERAVTDGINSFMKVITPFKFGKKNFYQENYIKNFGNSVHY